MRPFILYIVAGLLGYIGVMRPLNAQNSGFSYQAVVRNAQGQEQANRQVRFRFSLIRGSATGTNVYNETHSVLTGTSGLVNLVIGRGEAPSTNFNALDWSNGPYFLRTELDIDNGTNFRDLGTSQLMNVPFAMFAAKPDSAEVTRLARFQASKEVKKLGFSQNATWTCPPGVTEITVELWGGSGGQGGGSGSYLTSSDVETSCRGWFQYERSGGGPFSPIFYNHTAWRQSGGKGGDGGYTKSRIRVTPGETYQIVIGTGGLPGFSSSDGNSSAGTNGGLSSFGNFIFASGGTGGGPGNSTPGVFRNNVCWGGGGS